MNIPKISNEKLAELRKGIKPVVRFYPGENDLFPSGEGILFYIKETDPRTTNYMGNPVPTCMANNIEPLERIITHHHTGGCLFKPSEAEVLAQLSEDLHQIVVAYEIVTYEIEVDADDPNDSIAYLQLYQAA